jgi:hypothetical protein
VTTTETPGIAAHHAIITPTCRQGRGAVGAFEEAVRRLLIEYEVCAGAAANAEARFHLVLTVERTP